MLESGSHSRTRRPVKSKQMRQESSLSSPQPPSLTTVIVGCRIVARRFNRRQMVVFACRQWREIRGPGDGRRASRGSVSGKASGNLIHSSYVQNVSCQMILPWSVGSTVWSHQIPSTSKELNDISKAGTNERNMRHEVPPNSTTKGPVRPPESPRSPLSS